MLELLVALALLSGLVVIIAQYQTMSMAGQESAVQHTKALSKARILMEQIGAGLQEDQNPESEDGIALTWHVEPMAQPTGSFDGLAQDIPAGFAFVHVDAQWQGMNDASFTLINGQFQIGGGADD